MNPRAVSRGFNECSRDSEMCDRRATVRQVSPARVVYVRSSRDRGGVDAATVPPGVVWPTLQRAFPMIEATT